MFQDHAYRISTFRPEQAHRTELWAPGIVLFDTDPVYVQTRPEHVSLKCVFEGVEYYECEGRQMELRSGELGLVGPQSRLSGGVPKGRRAAGFAYFLPTELFDGHAANRAGGLEGFLEKAPALQSRLKPACDALARVLYQDNDPQHVLPVCERIQLTVSDYLAEVFSVSDTLALSRERARQRHASRLLAAREGLADCGHGTPVEDLARRHGYNRAQFSRLFTQAFGTTPRRFAEHSRLDRTRCLIEQTDHPLHVIAESVGYEDYPTFSKAYRRVFGAQPAAQRRATSPSELHTAIQ